MARLLVATPDEELRSTLLGEADRDSLPAAAVATSAELLEHIADRTYDVVVLDDRVTPVPLPDLVSTIAQGGCGLIVLSSDPRHADAIDLLELGADDVVGRPCSLPELRARTRAILRRRSPQPDGHSGRIVVGPLCLDVQTRSVTIRDKHLYVPRLEFAVLLALQKRDGAPVARSVLLDECWSAQIARRPEYVGAVMRRLRLRLEVDPARPRHLVTIRSKGYALWP